MVGEVAIWPEFWLRHHCAYPASYTSHACNGQLPIKQQCLNPLPGPGAITAVVLRCTEALCRDCTRAWRAAGSRVIPLQQRLNTSFPRECVDSERSRYMDDPISTCRTNIPLINWLATIRWASWRVNTALRMLAIKRHRVVTSLQIVNQDISATRIWLWPYPIPARENADRGGQRYPVPPLLLRSPMPPSTQYAHWRQVGGYGSAASRGGGAVSLSD